jgi:UDP-glucose 4-epimerase
VEVYSRNADEKHLPLSLLGNRLYEQEPPQALLHLAWSTVPSSAEIHPGSEWREDLPLLANLLETLTAIKKRDSRLPLFVFFSTCAVYGPGSADKPFGEEDPVQPIGWYATAKAEAERLIRRFAEQHGLPALILRITNPYGFTQNQETLQGVIPHLARAARTGSAFRVWGDGTARKDFLNVEDFCRGIDAALQARLTGTYNLCSGETHSIHELVQTAETTLGAPIQIQVEPGRPWDVTQAGYKRGKFSQATGWSPRVSLADGFRDYLQAG